MNIPAIQGYFRFPNTTTNRTRSYFAAFPALLPVVAVLEYQGTNPFVSATALFDGQSVPVIQSFGRLEARFSAKLSDIGRQMSLNWTLRFAQNPTVISYSHRVLITGVNFSIDPIPTLNGNPCNIPCGSQIIDSDTFANPLFFATGSNGTEYSGFGFNSSLVAPNLLNDWCNVVNAGFINVVPYTPPTLTAPPIWEERGRFCVQSVPRTNSDLIIVEIDVNPLSNTYGLTQFTTIVDAVTCPIGNTAPIWNDVSEPFCKPEPRIDCNKLVDREDINTLSATFGQVQTFELPYNNTDCVDCPPTNLLPDYQDTGEFRCVYPSDIGRQDSNAEKRQLDRNQFSPTFNQELWVSIGERPDLCPLDTNSCNYKVWIDAKTEDCELITRCLQNEPRTVSTRQKLQYQVNDVHPFEERWVDLPASPDDEALCPINDCPIWIPVCPLQIRCKYEDPRPSSMTERLEVNVNPNSATVGVQAWRDFEEDAALCPVPATQFSITSARLLSVQHASDTIVGCFSLFFTVSGGNFGLFPFPSVPAGNIIRRAYSLDRTVFSDYFSGQPPTDVPRWIEVGVTNGTLSFVDNIRFDDVIEWAKVYHRSFTSFIGSTRTLEVRFWATNAGTVQANLSNTLTIYDEDNNIIAFFDNLQETSRVEFSDSSYGLTYTNNSCTAQPAFQNAPHRNRTVDPNEALSLGINYTLTYFVPALGFVGLYKYRHDIFIAGELYAFQEGYVRNL
jgi:hypothetical protein